MNDTPQTRETSNTGSILMAFSIGAVLGAGVALLLAPDSGKHTRQRLATTARRWGASASHTLHEARDTVAELGTDAKSALKVGREAFLHDRETRSERRAARTVDTCQGLDAARRAGEEVAG